MSEQSLWMSLRTVEIVTDEEFHWPRVDLVTDGVTLAEVRHSERYRPAGCQVQIRDDNFGTFVFASRSRIDLRRNLVSFWMRPAQHKKYVSLELGKPKDGLECVVARREDASINLWLDPKWDHRLIRAELFLTAESLDVPYEVHEYRYAREGDDVVPRELKLHARVTPISAPAAMFDIYRMVFTSLSAGTTIQEFNMDSLELCPGARVIDRREKAETRVRNSSPTVISETKNESVAAQVSKLPDRYASPPTDPQPNSPSWQRTLTLLLINVVAIFVICGVWLLRKRKKASDA